MNKQRSGAREKAYIYDATGRGGVREKEAHYRVSESHNDYRFRHQYRIGHGVAFLIHSVRSRRDAESSESARGTGVGRKTSGKKHQKKYM